MGTTFSATLYPKSMGGHCAQDCKVVECGSEGVVAAMQEFVGADEATAQLAAALKQQSATVAQTHAAGPRVNKDLQIAGDLFMKLEYDICAAVHGRSGGAVQKCFRCFFPVSVPHEGATALSGTRIRKNWHTCIHTCIHTCMHACMNVCGREP